MGDKKARRERKEREKITEERKGKKEEWKQRGKKVTKDPVKAERWKGK